MAESWDELCADAWRAWKPAGAPADAWERLGAELAVRYAEPHRAYHDARHIAEMTALLAGRAREMRDAFAVMMAAFFHDAVLVAGAKDNEAKSAALAAERLAPFAGEARRARIAQLIRATEAHAPDPSDLDLALLVDADLAILGAAPERFDAYDRGIRAEYAHVPGLLYAIGRKKFLQRMSARERLFLDAAMRERFEAPARANLARALR